MSDLNFFSKFVFFVTFAVTRTRGRDNRIAKLGGLGQGTRSPLVSEEEHIGGSAPASQSVGIPGGSYDTSFLVKYEHHVVRHLWFDEVNKRYLHYFE